MKVELITYNTAWPALFEKEKARLLNAIGTWIVGPIEHVGSTAVPGMVAKPVIDIMCGVKSLDDAKGAIEVLEAHGYCYYPYKAELMHWFCKPSPDVRTHHLHLIPYQSSLWQERIQFRDLLRTDSEVASEYSALKVSLARQYATDREQYTQLKWPFIKRALGLAER